MIFHRRKVEFFTTCASGLLFSHGHFHCAGTHPVENLPPPQDICFNFPIISKNMKKAKEKSPYIIEIYRTKIELFILRRMVYFN